MTQDVMVQSFHANFDHASSAVISTIIGASEEGKYSPGSIRVIRRDTPPPHNAMIRLAVLNALRPTTGYSRI